MNYGAEFNAYYTKRSAVTHFTILQHHKVEVLNSVIKVIFHPLLEFFLANNITNIFVYKIVSVEKDTNVRGSRSSE